MLEHAITHSDPHKQGKGHLQKLIKKKSCNLKQRQERDVLAVVLWKDLYHVGFFFFFNPFDRPPKVILMALSYFPLIGLAEALAMGIWDWVGLRVMGCHLLSVFLSMIDRYP